MAEIEQNQRLSGSLQENVLTVLCFDDENAGLVRAAVTARTFESALYREVAGAAIDFYDNYREAIKDHLPDALEHVLAEGGRKARAYELLLHNLSEARGRVNAEYVVAQLQKFVRMQRFKSALIDAVDAVENRGDIDAAEVIMQEGMRSQSVSFDRGLALDSPEDVAALLDDPEEEGFALGISELDRAGIVPRRKEVFLLIGPRGRGKSWWVTHCCKQALLQRWRPVVYTLEMSEKRYGVRFLQSWFGIARREAVVRVARLRTGRDGELRDIDLVDMERQTLADPDTRDAMVDRAKREFLRREPIRFKQFPTGEMTLDMMEAHLDGLERHDKFVPDAICVDYPDLARLDPKNLRLELGAWIAKFRGICVRRNAAGIIVSQGNRDAETARVVTGAMAAEDISKLATADVVVTLSQTDAEYSIGLARIFVEKARNAKGKLMLLITQALELGQFCLDSVCVRTEEYFDLLDDRTGSRRRRRVEEDDDDPPRQERRSARGRRRED